MTHCMTPGTMIRLACLGALGAAGCMPSYRGVPVDSAKPPNAGFAGARARLVNDRYLLLPVAATTGKSTGIAFGKKEFRWSSWSGSMFEKSMGECWLDIVIVDVETGAKHRVFEHPAAVGTWTISFEDGRGDKLRYQDTLILPARTEDADDNGYIDYDDPLAVYAYDLKTNQRVRVSPDGYHVDAVQFMEREFLLVLEDLKNRARTSVYLYDPAARRGRFVVEGMTALE